MKPLQNVRQVLHTIKHRKPTQIFCPRCASPNITQTSTFNMWLLPQNHRCHNCGYTGPIVMELEKLENQEIQQKEEGNVP